MTQILNKESEKPSHWRGTKVQVEWRQWRQGTDTLEAWNEICSWTIEQFGLPGTRFTWHATEDYMNFYFHHEEDAVHFMLRWL